MDSKGAKILIVDSRKSVLQKLIKYLLEGGYRSLLCVHKGEDCLELVEKEQPAIVLMSWETDGHDAIATLERMKKGAQARDIPVMIYTGTMKEKPHLKKALKAGVIQFISEPFDQQEFLLSVDNMIRLSGMIRRGRLDTDAEILKAQNEQLRLDMENLNREVRLSRLRESHWNDFMTWLLDRLHHLSVEEEMPPEEIKPVLKQMISDCKKRKNVRLWKELKMRIVENHMEAFQQLIRDFPSLTVNDLRILAFIRLHLSTKEIAHITFKPVNTIKAARKRIRKKLGITRKSLSLVAFLARY